MCCNNHVPSALRVPGGCGGAGSEATNDSDNNIYEGETQTTPEGQQWGNTKHSHEVLHPIIPYNPHTIRHYPALCDCGCVPALRRHVTQP